MSGSGSGPVAHPRLAAALVMAVLAGAGCGGTPRDAVVDGGPVTASTTVDGVVVGLSIDRRVVAAGATLRVIATVRNLGREPVHWRAGGCALRGAVRVVADEEGAVETGVDGTEPDQGALGDGGAAGDGGAVTELAGDIGDRRVARFIAALAGPADAIAASSTPPTGSAAGDRSCQIDHGFAVLGPGEELEERAAWAATTAAGVPLPPGRYEVLASFPMLGGATPLVPADFRGDRDLAPVEAGIGLDIEAAGPAHPSAADAVAAMLAATPLDGWVRAGSISAVDGALAYDATGWSLTVRVPTGGTATAFAMPDGRVDPDLRFAP